MLLEVNHISKSFGEQSVLTDVSFLLKEGETLVLTGKSGEGKSTLLKIISGLVEADTGEVLFRNNRVSGPSGKLIPGHPEIKLVNQQFELDSFHTVEENIRLKTMHHSRAISDELVSELLQVIGLEHRKNQQAIQLSGGEQQRLALARCLAEEPDILCLDEPFVHLDPLIRRQVERYIRDKRQQWQSALILVTHDGREAMQWADRILFLADGRIARSATPKQFYEQPENLYQALFFGEMNEVEWEGSTRMFRPEAYSIVQKGGVLVQVSRTAFGGNYWVNYAHTHDQQHIVLFSAEPLNGFVRIEPNYVE
jgi:iron(III) transport system ATP-binding protein